MQQSNGLAVAGMVVGIVSIVAAFFLWWLGLIVGIVGIVLSAMAMKRPGGRGMAVAGLVCSIIGAVLSLSTILCVMCALGSLAAVGASL